MIERARGFLSREALAFERVVSGMQKAQSSLESARVGVLASQARLDAATSRLETTEAEAADAERKRREASPAGERGPLASPRLALKKGMNVYVPRLRREAQILELLGGGNVRVAAGAMKMVLDPSELEASRK